MRMNAVLSNPKHPEYGQYTVPLPIPSDQYDGLIEALNAMGMGDPLARDCQMDEIFGEYPILKRLEGKPVNIDELDYLAKRLDSFCCALEGAQFQGAAVSYDYSDMADLINLTFSCQQVTVITDFSDLEQVGREHYMVLNGGCASKEELDNLDGYETALLLIDEGDGVVTPYGVVYDNGMCLSQVYDGRHFPQYFYEPPLLTLTVQESKGAPQTWLYLPAPDLQIKRSLIRAGIVDPADMELSFQASEFPDAVDCVLDMKSESLEELNKLCRSILNAFAQKGLIYESRELSKDKTKEYHNAVFVGIDEHGVARHAHKRGIYTQGKSYRGNVEGCDPRHSFHWTGTSDRLYVFEAPIDLLAFLTLYPEDWQQHSYVALCGTAEHAMLWMLEQNPKLQKIILCLDHDAAGIEAAGRLTDILCKHGYTQSAPLRSTNKDWDEDLKEQHGLEPQPPEEHPQLIVAGTICERIGAKCKAVRPEQASYQIPRLLQQYQNDLHWGRFEQAMDHMETMSALALSVVLRECRQMGTVLTEEQGARFLQSHIHPHQNRGSLKTRATEIGMEFQSVLAKDAVEGIRTEVEKKATASAWLELAISCAKVPIKYCADELRRQQKEEKALLEAAQAMASY